ncbi:uncharacterized protein LOC144094810 [Amblyomma americanum]
MLLRRSCFLFCSLVAVCWTGSALGNQTQENPCNGLCLATSQPTELCEVISTTSRCQEEGQLCCLKFSVPDLSTEPGGPLSPKVEAASWGSSGQLEESGRQYRNVYLDILGVVVSEALRAAIASEYESINEKAASFNATRQTDPTPDRVTTSPETSRSSSESPSQSSTASSVSNNGAPELLTPYDIDSNASTEPYVPDSSDGINSTPSKPAEGALSSRNSSSSRSPTRGSANETAQNSSTSPTTDEAASSTEGSGLPCPGTCVQSFVSWFCYNLRSEYKCPEGTTCCAPAPTTPKPEVPPCPGACLPAQLTGLCKRPARLLLRTTTCSRETICCTDTPRIW